MSAQRRAGVGPVHHIALSVRDLDASTRFYAGFLGLRQTLRTEVSGGGFERIMCVREGDRAQVRYFDGGQHIGQIELIQWEGREAPSHRDDPPYEICVLAFSVSGDELDELLAAAPGRGYEVASGPELMVLPDYGPIRSALIRDPDGRRVELVALPDKETIREARRSAYA